MPAGRSDRHSDRSLAAALAVALGRGSDADREVLAIVASAAASTVAA